jgi:hypothetical protein
MNVSFAIHHHTYINITTHQIHSQCVAAEIVIVHTWMHLVVVEADTLLGAVGSR